MSKPFKCTRERTETWRVLSLDVWGNARDGYEVNAAYTTTRTVKLPPSATDDEVIACLKMDGEITKPVRRRFVEVQDFGDDMIGIDYRGRPEIQLQKEE
jgi:hypothetical protein